MFQDNVDFKRRKTLKKNHLSLVKHIFIKKKKINNLGEVINSFQIKILL